MNAIIFSVFAACFVASFGAYLTQRVLRYAEFEDSQSRITDRILRAYAVSFERALIMIARQYGYTDSRVFAKMASEALADMEDVTAS